MIDANYIVCTKDNWLKKQKNNIIDQNRYGEELNIYIWFDIEETINVIWY